LKFISINLDRGQIEEETMIVSVINPANGLTELCLLEFQGEIVGKEVGGSLGSIKLKGGVSTYQYYYYDTHHLF